MALLLHLHDMTDQPSHHTSGENELVVVARCDVCVNVTPLVTVQPGWLETKKSWWESHPCPAPGHWHHPAGEPGEQRDSGLVVKVTTGRV